MKTKIEFLSNDVDRVFNYFKSLETIESIFGIQYAWEDGSFDSEVGYCDLNKVKFNGIVYDEYPLMLSVMHDEDERSFSDSFSDAKVKELNKAQKNHYRSWKLEANARR